MNIVVVQSFLKDFFMWMTVINLGIFTFSAVFCMAARGFIQRIHGKCFGLSPEAINAILYGFLGLYKIVFIVFCLTPWLVLLIIG